MEETTLNKRRDFGEAIPGSRKDIAQRTSRALEELAALSDVENDSLTGRQALAKLVEIRRDDIWGSLEDRLADLQSRGASPAQALAWRVLYRGVAASAGSMDLKPTHGKYFYTTPKDAYIFGLCYESALRAIATSMEELFPLDATWTEINDVGLTTPSNPAYLDGSGMISQIRRLRDDGDISAPDAVNAWLSIHVDSRNPIVLVRKRGASSRDPLYQAKRDVFNEYAPSWKKELENLVNEEGAGTGLSGDEYGNFTHDVTYFLKNALVGKYLHADEYMTVLTRQVHLVAPHFSSLDLMADELYSRIARTPDFAPFVTVKQAKKTDNASETQEFESILTKKIMPATRFDDLKREAKAGSPSPRKGNITEDDLCKLVPFRGIQYGNWATQAERQEMLNMAYDAMSDLALALGVSPQYLAIPVPEGQETKTLGLALGARGRGGNAAAHYEPSVHVINLTKTKGGGSLAHEWMHAYDHKLATDTGGRASFASDIAGNKVYDFVRRLRNRDNRNSDGEDVVKMSRRDLMLATLLTPDMEKKLAQASGGNEFWKKFGPAMIETIVDWTESPAPVLAYACSGRSLKGEVIERNMESGLISHGVPELAAKSISTVFATGTPSSEWIKLHKRIDRSNSLNRGASAYLIGAQILNGNKAEGYWTNPTELFARAGSAIVFDRLREIHGVVNGFLDESSNPDRFDPKMHKASPNPAGTERKWFRGAFEETLLVAILEEDAAASYQKEHEVDKALDVAVGAQMRMRF